MTADQPRVAAILLAAGSSTRLGHPKQLVRYGGRTLVRHAAETLIAGGLSRIIAVTGFEAASVAAELNGLDLTIRLNTAWATGIASSIVVGVEAVREADADAVFISLCDQPYVRSSDIRALLTHFNETRPEIVASAYDDAIGVPAIFSREMFGDLARLSGDQGARYLIRQRSNVATVPVPAAAFDIDTPADEAIIRG